MIEGEHYIAVPENFEIDNFMQWAKENDDLAK